MELNYHHSLPLYAKIHPEVHSTRFYTRMLDTGLQFLWVFWRENLFCYIRQTVGYLAPEHNYAPFLLNKMRKNSKARTGVGQ